MRTLLFIATTTLTCFSILRGPARGLAKMIVGATGQASGPPTPSEHWTAAGRTRGNSLAGLPMCRSEVPPRLSPAGRMRARKAKHRPLRIRRWARWKPHGFHDQLYRGSGDPRAATRIFPFAPRPSAPLRGRLGEGRCLGGPLGKTQHGRIWDVPLQGSILAVASVLGGNE